MVEHSSPREIFLWNGNPRSALRLSAATIQYCSAESLVISLWASVSSALRKWILKMCCVQKLHIVRKIWGIRFAIPYKPTGLWKLAHPVCAWKRLSSLDLFRYVHLYIGTKCDQYPSVITLECFSVHLKTTWNYTKRKKDVFLSIRIIHVLKKNNFQQYTFSYFILNFSTNPHSWSEINQRARTLPKMSVNNVPCANIKYGQQILISKLNV